MIDHIKSKKEGIEYLREVKAVQYLIVGNSAAGTFAAERIRANDPNGQVAILTDEVLSRLCPLYDILLFDRPVPG